MGELTGEVQNLDDYYRTPNDGVPTPQMPLVSALGACLCTSFKWNTSTGECKVCDHEAHGSRIHCGVMVRG